MLLQRLLFTRTLGSSNAILTSGCSPIRVDREEADDVQHCETDDGLEPAVCRPVSAVSAGRPRTRRLRRAERVALGLESGRGARRLLGGVGRRGADGAAQGGRVGAADRLDDRGPLEDEEGGHAVGGRALVSTRLWREAWLGSLGQGSTARRKTYAETPKRCATSATASTSTDTNWMRPGRASCSASWAKTGAITLHGPHQVAWKSTTVYVAARSSESNCAADVAAVTADDGGAMADSLCGACGLG